MIESIEKGRQEDGNRSIADKIIKRLHDLDKTVEYNQGRWAWELLQNAKDSIADESDRTVSIQIELNENHVEFRHSGTHFTEQDIRGLINQISSKEVEEGEDSKKTGQFGTGFLTTHLLSKVIQVKGIVKTDSNDFYRFEFPLDRQGTKINLLAQKIENAWSEFQNSVKKIEIDYNQNEFNTSFCYALKTEKQKEIARIGINEFSKLLPCVLAFIPKISDVNIIDNTLNKNTTFKNNHEAIRGILKSIKKTENGEDTEILILHVEGQRVSIATEVEKTNKGYSIKSIKNIPKLFCDFPLIGTENFHFPAIINSFFFIPQTERDGIWLKSNTDDLEVKENQKLVETALSLYENLINQVTEENFFDLYNLVETKIPSTNENNFDTTWYKESIQKPIREFIKQSAVVETELGKVKLDDIQFPDPSLKKEDREKIWQFSSDLKVNKLPAKQHIHKWAEIIWADCNKVDIADLVTDLKDMGNISSLINTLNVDEQKTFNWLNECIGFIKINDDISTFNSNALLPNQEGVFKTLTELSVDEIEDETLKEIASLVGYNCYEELIHNRIFFEDCYSVVRIQDIANQITKFIDTENNISTENRKTAILKLTEWFEDNEEKGKVNFSALFRNKEKLFVDTIDDKENLYRILKNTIPLSKIVKVIDQIYENPNIIEESIEKARKLDSLMNEYGAADVSDLKRMLELNKNESLPVPKTEITQDILSSLGIASIEELKEAMKDTILASQFCHTSIPTIEMFEYAQKIIGRAKLNVIEYLQNHPDYDCSEQEELATTVIGGIKKQGLPIIIVIRPSDNRQIIVYYRSEKDSLDYEDAELWIDNGKDKPMHLTLGKILKKTGITKIPV